MATTQGKQPPGKNKYKYRQQFGVIVICKDEKHQQQTYQALRGSGHQVKVVTV